jgi:hypothetical protein
MAIKPDPIILKKLALVKQIYQRALVSSTSQQNEVGRILSVIEFDLAVETVLKAIIDALDPRSSPKDEKSFPQYVDKAEKLLSNEPLSLPDKRNIKYVHDIRNYAQHRGQSPSESDVNDCRTYVRDFLHNTTQEVWGLAFEKISLADLIQNAMIKGFLAEAEALLAQSSYKEATLAAVRGMTRATDLVKRAILGRVHRPEKEVIVSQGRHQKPSKEIYRTLEETRESLAYVALGLDYVGFLRYEKLLRKFNITVHVYDDGLSRYYAPGLDEITCDEAETLITYCIDTVVQIENKVGNLDKPFE